MRKLIRFHSYSLAEGEVFYCDRCDKLSNAVDPPFETAYILLPGKGEDGIRLYCENCSETMYEDARKGGA